MSRKAEAIINLIDAYNELKSAKESCAHDIDYFCRIEIERYEKACQELEEVFSS